MPMKHQIGYEKNVLTIYSILGKKTACFSFFDDKIDNNIKIHMTNRLLENVEFEDDDVNTDNTNI